MDGTEFLALAPQVPVRAEVERFALEDANEALLRMKSGELREDFFYRYKEWKPDKDLKKPRDTAFAEVLLPVRAVH